MRRHAALRTCQDIGALRQQNTQHTFAATPIHLPDAIHLRQILRLRQPHACLGCVVLLQRCAHCRVVCQRIIHCLLHGKLPHLRRRHRSNHGLLRPGLRAGDQERTHAKSTAPLPQPAHLLVHWLSYCNFLFCGFVRIHVGLPRTMSLICVHSQGETSRISQQNSLFCGYTPACN